MNITQTECVFVALGLQLAERMRHIVICALPRYTMYFHIISQTARFSKKLLNTKCVFLFSVQLLSETFLIVKITQRNIINARRCLCKVLTILVRLQ
jgi:hypothetical protein